MYPNYGAKNYLDEDFIEIISTEVYPSNAVYLKKKLSLNMSVYGNYSCPKVYSEIFGLFPFDQKWD